MVNGTEWTYEDSLEIRGVLAGALANSDDDGGQLRDVMAGVALAGDVEVAAPVLPTKSLGSTQVGRTTDNITTVDNVARLNPLVIPLTTSLGLTRVGQTIDSIARLDPSVMPLTTSLGSTPRSCI